jgi:hypothetical protein
MWRAQTLPIGATQVFDTGSFIVMSPDELPGAKRRHSVGIVKRGCFTRENHTSQPTARGWSMCVLFL